MLSSQKLNINIKGEICYISFPLFDKYGIKNAFSTRLGGVSTGQFANMNLGLTNADRPENIKENYHRFCGAVGFNPSRLVASKQTHTTNVRVVTKADIGKGFVLPLDYDNTDGLITDIEDVGLVTFYADCVPLLFFDPIHRVVGAAHSGWRGTVGQIGAHIVKKMEQQFGCNPCDIIAAIGPCICADCYEVDTPVYEQFCASEGLNVELFTKKVDNTHYLLDLKKANLQILTNAGLLPKNIDVADLCTCCNSTYLHSHRATGGKRGIMAAIISL